MNYIRIISLAFLYSAALKTSAADFGDDAILNPFISSDGASTGGPGVFGDSSGDFPEDFPALPPETTNISFDPGFDEYGEGLEDSLATTYAQDGCSVHNHQRLGKKLRVREAPALCPVDPKPFSDQQTDSDDNSNANGKNDFIFKNSDGFQTEPKNSDGLNRYGTNSDGTICPPTMWLLCSSIEYDYEGSCLGCYPCEFSVLLLRLPVVNKKNKKKPPFAANSCFQISSYISQVWCIVSLRGEFFAAEFTIQL